MWAGSGVCSRRNLINWAMLWRCWQAVAQSWWSGVLSVAADTDTGNQCRRGWREVAPRDCSRQQAPHSLAQWQPLELHCPDLPLNPDHPTSVGSLNSGGVNFQNVTQGTKWFRKDQTLKTVFLETRPIIRRRKERTTRTTTGVRRREARTATGPPVQRSV